MPLRKKFVCLLLCLASGTAMADAKDVGPDSDTTQSANHATANEPFVATDGLSILNMCGLRVIVSAASGQTLSGAGTLRFWYYDTTLSSPRWMLNQNVSLPVTQSSRRDAVFEDLPIYNGFGRVYVEAESVTVSSGVLTVRLETAPCKR